MITDSIHDVPREHHLGSISSILSCDTAKITINEREREGDFAGIKFGGFGEKNKFDEFKVFWKLIL